MGAATQQQDSAVGGAPGGHPAAAARALRAARLESPLAPYYLILGSTISLTLLGLVMVLSSSSVESLASTRLASSYLFFGKQLMFAGVGVPLAWLASRLPVTFWKRCSWLMMAGSCGLLVLVPLIGSSVNGNTNWIPLGPVALQPSEIAKLALILWSAAVLSSKLPLLDDITHLVVPVMPAAVMLIGLVLVGRDLGTAMIIMAIVFGVLFTAGLPLRAFAVIGAGALLAVGLLVTTSSNRMDRIAAFLGGSHGSDDPQGLGAQAIHGLWALASGGWWGVGLGGSKEKWLWLPEAHNDFIFAIIGEELGLTGTLSVLVLFALLGVGLVRLAAASEDLFVRITAGGMLIWVVGQAVINIGAVLKVMPIVGVPLPLVSSGGSSLVTTMVGLGIVLGMARRVPGAEQALAARTGVVRRSLAVVPRRAGGLATRATRHRASRVGRGGGVR